MGESAFRAGVITLVFCILWMMPLSAVAQDRDGSLLVPAPDPFSLDTESAIFCINLLKGNRFLEKSMETEEYRVVQVETVWSWFLAYDEGYPEGHRLRYDIIVNGETLDWERSYIEYGTDIVNLKILFLYRNQHPREGSPDYILKEF